MKNFLSVKLNWTELDRWFLRRFRSLEWVNLFLLCWIAIVSHWRRLWPFKAFLTQGGFMPKLFGLVVVCRRRRQHNHASISYHLFPCQHAMFLIRTPTYPISVIPQNSKIITYSCNPTWGPHQVWDKERRMKGRGEGGHSKVPVPSLIEIGSYCGMLREW